ncbi:alpha/beta hydrolase family protein [Streptomyces sp. NPDC058457]|uniref:alpha/beta hydrolase family protein n=1 Tax=Streptomyces sp. NPDC058457 TaxID=3346507 RepID=UPI00365087F0
MGGAGFARFLDLAEADFRLAGAIGVQGVSFGGLFAAHLAAADPRVGAVVVNGAPAAPTVPEFRTARERLAAALGTDAPDRIAEVMDALCFDPDRHRVACPLLLLHGGHDPLARYEDQEPFLRAADPVTATLRIWPDGERTLYSHAAEPTRRPPPPRRTVPAVPTCETCFTWATRFLHSMKMKVQ